jgi:hypothetical protein
MRARPRTARRPEYEYVDPHGSVASGTPLSERAARELGVAISVAAHSPPAIDILGALRIGKEPRLADGWNGGGCHVFALALAEWLKSSERRAIVERRYVDLRHRDLPVRVDIAKRAHRVVTPEKPRVRVIAQPGPARPYLVHVVLAFRGWHFDDRGAWTEREIRHVYGGFALVDYFPQRFRKMHLARDPKDVTALAEVFHHALGSWRDWAPDPPTGGAEQLELGNVFLRRGAGRCPIPYVSYDKRNEALDAARSKRRGKGGEGRRRMSKTRVALEERLAGMEDAPVVATARKVPARRGR